VPEKFGGVGGSWEIHFWRKTQDKRYRIQEMNDWRYE